MPQGKIERIHREKGFTQIDNRLLTDKNLGLEGIGLLSHILHYSDSFEIYKSVLQREWGRAMVERAWEKGTKSGYIIGFKNYSTNDSKNSYRYAFDEYQFSGIDLMSYFEEQWEQGYLFYAKSLYQVANRNLKTIEASFPQFLFPTEDNTEEEKNKLEELRKTLAKFVFERLPKETTHMNQEYPSQTFEEQAIEIEKEKVNIADDKSMKPSSTEIFINDFPEYLSIIEALEKKKLTKSELDDIADTLYSVAVDVDLKCEDNRMRVHLFQTIFREQMFANENLCQYDWIGYFKKGIQSRLKDFLLSNKQYQVSL
ncbi:hypothetical protein ABLU29_07430 [Lactococcus lactis]|uniref:hypothetical protein n=1 Tax=Lactococcus lactis TaxID=1358 RepID=UPI0038780164